MPAQNNAPHDKTWSDTLGVNWLLRFLNQRGSPSKLVPAEVSPIHEVKEKLKSIPSEELTPAKPSVVRPTPKARTAEAGTFTDIRRSTIDKATSTNIRPLTVEAGTITNISIKHGAFLKEADSQTFRDDIPPSARPDFYKLGAGSVVVSAMFKVYALLIRSNAVYGYYGNFPTKRKMLAQWKKELNDIHYQTKTLWIRTCLEWKGPTRGESQGQRSTAGNPNPPSHIYATMRQENETPIDLMTPQNDIDQGAEFSSSNVSQKPIKRPR